MRQLRDIRIFSLHRDLVAVQILLFRPNRVMEDIDLGHLLCLNLEILLRFLLSNGSCLLGVLILRLHVVVLLGKGRDLFLLVSRVRYRLLLHLIHVLLQRHDRAGHRDVLAGCSRGVAGRLFTLLGALEPNFDESIFVSALSQRKSMNLEVSCAVLAQVKVSLAKDAAGLVTQDH